MRRFSGQIVLLACLLPLLGCAAAPHPAAPPPEPAPVATPVPVAPPPPPPAAPAVPQSQLICAVQQARRISFADLGLPAGSRPIDLALGKGKVWILFAPSLLVGIPRAVDARGPAAIAEYGQVEEEMDMVPGPRPDAWRSLAIDPWDGTLWLASPSGLWRRRAGRRPEVMTVTGAPRGFAGVAPARNALWVAPACAANAVWKLDSKGKVLATALPQPAAQAPGACAAVWLQRDWSGALLALLPGTAGEGELFRLAFDGSWKPAGSIPLPPTLHSWFFWGTEPLSLGAAPDDPEPLLYRRIDGRATAFHEDCGPGNALVRVDGDAKGWAALTREWLLIGEHAAGQQQEEPGSH
jgi:hypothetical protein